MTDLTTFDKLKGAALIAPFIGVLTIFAVWVSLWENVWSVTALVAVRDGETECPLAKTRRYLARLAVWITISFAAPGTATAGFDDWLTGLLGGEPGFGGRCMNEAEGMIERLGVSPSYDPANNAVIG